MKENYGYLMNSKINLTKIKIKPGTKICKVFPNVYVLLYFIFIKNVKYGNTYNKTEIIKFKFI